MARPLKNTGVIRFGAGHRRKKTSAPVEALPLTTAPDGMTADARVVWDRLAPLAAAQRTLAPETVEAFVLLCSAVTRLAAIQRQLDADGLTFEKLTIDGSGQEHRELKAHPLLGHQRALMQRVEQGLARFRLAPTGQPLAASQTATDPLDKFFRHGA